jgi:hypothetical protein
MKLVLLNVFTLRQFPVLLGILLLPVTDAFSVSSSPLSAAAADAVIREEMASQTARDAERKARLLEVPALEEAVVRQGEDIILLRRVAHQAPSARNQDERLVTLPEPVGENTSAPPPDRRPHKSLTIFVTIFDNGLTEIRSMHGEKEQARLTTLSNVDFSWLPGISTVESESAVYTVLAIVNRVNRETDPDRSPPDPGVFSTQTREYIVESETDAPAEALAAIDALHRHYLKHKVQFEADGRRAEAMRAARERQNQPAPPRETVINLAPVRSRMHQ